MLRKQADANGWVHPPVINVQRIEIFQTPFFMIDRQQGS